MNRAHITELALRLLAVYAWFQGFWEGIRGIAFFSTFRDSTQGVDPIYGVVASTVAYAVCGILVYMWAGPLSRRMFPAESDAPLKNHAEIGGLALRILGIMLWTWAVEALPGALLRGLWRDSLGSNVELAVAFLLVVMGTWLFVRGNKIAIWLLRTAPASGGRSMVQAQAIAIAVAGLVVFAKSLPGGVLVVAGWTVRRFGDASDSPQFGRFQWPASFAPIALMVIGLLLFLGSGGIAFFWHRTRTAGLTTSLPSADRDPT